MASGIGIVLLAQRDPHAEYIEDFGKPSGDGSTRDGRVARNMVSAAQCAAYDAACLLPFATQVTDLGCPFLIKGVRLCVCNSHQHFDSGQVVWG